MKETNARGTIAFATDGPNTRTTEVFINLVDNPAARRRGFVAVRQGRSKDGGGGRAFLRYGEVQPRSRASIRTSTWPRATRISSDSFPNLDGIISAKVMAQ